MNKNWDVGEVGLWQLLRICYVQLLTSRCQSLPCQTIQRLICLPWNTSTECPVGSEMGRSDFSHLELCYPSWEMFCVNSLLKLQILSQNILPCLALWELLTDKELYHFKKKKPGVAFVSGMKSFFIELTSLAFKLICYILLDTVMWT